MSPSGAGSVAAGPAANQVTVNLGGVPNAQRISVALGNISDNAGARLGNLVVPMGILLGDTTVNGAVNSSDIAQTKSFSGVAVTSDNFLNDVTVNGAINSSDISLVKSKSGTAISP